MDIKTKRALKIMGLFAMLIIVIISSAAFWNVIAAGTATVVGGFEIAVSIINFLIELGLLVHFGRKYLVQ